MTKEQMMERLEQASMLLEKKKDLELRIQKVRKKYQELGQVRKIGILGRICMVLSILGAGFIALMAAFFWFLEKYCLNDAEYHEMIEEEFGMSGKSLEIMLLALALSLPILLRLWIGFYNFSRNIKIRIRNVKIQKENSKVSKQEQELLSELNQIKLKKDKYLSSWYPMDYQNTDAANYFYSAIKNGKADSLREAVWLYDNYRQNREILAEQERENKLIEEKIRQDKLLKNAVITGTAYLSSQAAKGLENQKKVIEGKDKEIQELKRRIEELEKQK